MTSHLNEDIKLNPSQHVAMPDVC